MKKVFFGFVALSLIMLTTSCNNETVEVNPDLGNMLTFKAATGKQTLTRATEVNLGTLEGDVNGLLVKSFKPNGDLYKDYIIKGNLGWSYGPQEYHPLTYNLYHFSVYPSSVIMNNEGGSDGGTVTFNYTVADNYADQVDLMVAKATSTPDEGIAELVYKHILTQVNFAIQGQPGLIVEISDLKLTNIKYEGIYTFGLGWIIDPNTIDFEYYDAETTGDEPNDILYLGNTGDAASTVNNETNNALMLLPQTLDDDAKLTFSFKFQNSPASESISVKLNELDVTEWLEGKRYLYKLIFDPVFLVFTVEVDEEGWVDYDNAGGIIEVDTEDYD